MMEWQGDPGFDDNIGELVQNDFPAFLIGGQRNTMEPFSGSQASHVMESGDNAMPGNLNDGLIQPVDNAAGSQLNPNPTMHSYRCIERLLLAHVTKELGRGHVPSDQLRHKTSEMMYGPDNMWD
ncbi:hypothetical protein J3459_018311 [Metarhizium acridum]|nr:hypothetical protein J3459_018311 [Metarhizium acridum]